MHQGLPIIRIAHAFNERLSHETKPLFEQEMNAILNMPANQFEPIQFNETFADYSAMNENLSRNALNDL